MFLDNTRKAVNNAIEAEALRSDMENPPTNVQELLQQIFVPELQAGDFRAAGDNPISNLIDGVGNFFGDLGNTVQAVITNGVGNDKTPSVGSNILSDFNAITDDAGKFLGNVTGGIVNTDVVNSALNIVASTADAFVQGRVDLPYVIDQVAALANKFVGSENPLGTFVQNISNYLSNNQDGIIANIIKLGTFINAAIVTIAAIFFNSASNVVGAASKSVYNIFSGVVNNILGAFTGRLQIANPESFEVYRAAFMDVINADQVATAQLDMSTILNLLTSGVVSALDAPLRAAAFEVPNTVFDLTLNESVTYSAQQDFSAIFDQIIKALLAALRKVKIPNAIDLSNIQNAMFQAVSLQEGEVSFKAAEEAANIGSIAKNAATTLISEASTSGSNLAACHNYVSGIIMAQAEQVSFTAAGFTDNWNSMWQNVISQVSQTAFNPASEEAALCAQAVRESMVSVDDVYSQADSVADFTNFIVNVINIIVHNVFHRVQAPMDMFSQAQASNFTLAALAPTSYGKQLIDLFTTVGGKVAQSVNPLLILSIVSNPTQANIQKVVDIVVQILSAPR